MPKNRTCTRNEPNNAQREKEGWSRPSRSLRFYSRLLFSLTSSSSSVSSRLLLDWLAARILALQPCAQELLRADLSSSVIGVSVSTSLIINAFNRSLARIGARDRNDRSANFIMMAGLVNREETVCDAGDVGCDATVCKISPIWHVTAVQGRVPMNAPSMQSERGTPETPQAMLIPDHGTTPMSRKTERRTQAEEVESPFSDSDPEEP